MNIKDIIEKENIELHAKGFTSITLTENEIWENTIDVNVNFIRNNKYGATIKQVKYLESFKNVGRWNESGTCEMPSHSMMMGISRATVSFIIDLAKKYEDIDFNLVMNDMKK